MSDVTQPSPPPPSSPPPVNQTEVPVNEAPVNQPSPLGDQAPPKPDGQESNKSSQLSRREAIQNAFKRSKDAQDEATKRPAARTAPPDQKPDRSSEPGKKAAEGTEPTRPPQHREGGRFARDPSKSPLEPSPEQTPPGQQPQKYQPLDQSARFRDPPQRFSDQAKSEWAGAPESVRGAVHQMTREFQQAYQKYRGDHEVMETLRPYHELAQKQGTSIERAFTNYYNMEQKLRGDVFGGFDLITNNLRLKAPDGSPITFRDVAYAYLSQSPEQQRLTSQSNQQNASDARIGQLHEMIEQQGKQINQLVYHHRYTGTLDQVNEFAKTHPRLDELGAAIKQELDLGFPLDVAYRRAELLNPSTQAAQTRTQSAQTRRTSISGAPDGNGSSSSTTRPSDGQRKTNGEAQHPTRREALAKAMRRVSNGV